MAKNIVLCLDGTGNQLKASGNTNVVRLYDLLDLSDPSRQVAYYDPGVGTFSAQGAWTPIARLLSRLLGLAVGSGLRANLGEAYLYLMRTYEPGDKIYVFGFSRGAYTARALTGLLRGIGLLRPGSENLVQYAVSSYARREKKDADWTQMHEFARIFGVDLDGKRAVPVEFVGIWDTVKAAGVLRWSLKWPWTRRMPHVKTVRHAVSIDEKRRPYREYLVTVLPTEKTVLDEVWFAGVHSDVGGTFEDDPRLPRISLKWMAEGAVAAGLLVKADEYDEIRSLPADSAVGTVHRMGWIWGIFTYRRRPLPAGARVHASVRDRIEADPTSPHRGRLPEGVAWADEGWASGT